MAGTDPGLLARPCLAWGADHWRVAAADFWPAQQTSTTGRIEIAPPRRAAPACRLCGRSAHLCGRDRRPVHKLCLEVAVYHAAQSDGRLDEATAGELDGQTGAQAWLAELDTPGARAILAALAAPAATRGGLTAAA